MFRSAKRPVLSLRSEHHLPEAVRLHARQNRCSIRLLYTVRLTPFSGPACWTMAPNPLQINSWKIPHPTVPSTLPRRSNSLWSTLNSSVPKPPWSGHRPKPLNEPAMPASNPSSSRHQPSQLLNNAPLPATRTTGPRSHRSATPFTQLEELSKQVNMIWDNLKAPAVVNEFGQKETPAPINREGLRKKCPGSTSNNRYNLPL